MSKPRTIALFIACVFAVLSCLGAQIFILGRAVFYSMMVGVWLSAVFSERQRIWLGAALSTIALAAIVWLIIVFYRRWPSRYGD